MEKLHQLHLQRILMLTGDQESVAETIAAEVGITEVHGECLPQDKLTILKVSYFDSVKAGEISSRVVNDTNQVKQLLAVTFPQTVASVITVIGTVYMMIKMDWHMSLAMVIAVPVVILCMIPVMAFGSKVSHIRQDAMSQFNGLATETLSPA